MLGGNRGGIMNAKDVSKLGRWIWKISGATDQNSGIEDSIWLRIFLWLQVRIIVGN